MYDVTLADAETYERKLPHAQTDDFNRALHHARMMMIRWAGAKPVVACIQGKQYRTYYRIIDGVLTAIDRKEINDAD